MRYQLTKNKTIKLNCKATFQFLSILQHKAVDLSIISHFKSFW